MMCSEYQVKTNPKAIEKALGVPMLNTSGEISWDATVRVSSSAPVVEMGKDGPQLVTRVFPVSPFPNSRLSGFENQTDDSDDAAEIDNKQIKRIYDKPHWKKPFGEAPCLIPMTSFTEFAYWGDRAGEALSFEIPKEEVFFAAGIGIKPFRPSTGKTNGFSILTHTATEQMLDYHQRLIVVLKAKHAPEYLEEMSPEERFDFLIKRRFTGHLNVEKIRNMAKGWEKRVTVQKAKLHREERYRSTLRTEAVEG